MVEFWQLVGIAVSIVLSLVFAGITVLKFMSFWYRKMLCYSICPTVLAIVSVINFSLTGLQLDPLNVCIISTNQICV